MGIVRVLVVGVGGACAGQGQAAFLAQGGNALGAAGQHIQADKVTALGVGPVGDVAAGGQLGGESGLNGVKAGHQTAAMLGHMRQNTLLILQKADVAQLVHLVVADDHRRETAADVLHGVFAAGDRGHTGTGEGDLAGGGEHKHAILVAVLFGLVQQHGRFDDLLGQVVDDVRLVPEDLEIGRGGFHGGKAADGLVAVGVAVGVGILRHAPDALDGIVLGHELFDHIHIGAGLGHGDVDHLKAEILGDGKVAVIAGHRAKELALFDLRPRAGRILKTEDVADGHKVVHQLQAGVAAHKNFAGSRAHHVGKQLAGLVQTLQIAVVAGVGALIGGVIVHLQKVHCQIHLVRTGLAARHIQVKTHRLILFILRFQRGLFGGKLIDIHCKIISHFPFPPVCFLPLYVPSIQTHTKAYTTLYTICGK